MYNMIPKLPWSFLPADEGESWSLYRLLDSTVQPESTYFCILKVVGLVCKSQKSSCGGWRKTSKDTLWWLDGVGSGYLIYMRFLFPFLYGG